MSRRTVNLLVEFGWYDGLKTRRSVTQDEEVWRGWRSHRRWPILHVHLIVDETPLLQECMHSTHHGQPLTHTLNITLSPATYYSIAGLRHPLIKFNFQLIVSSAWPLHNYCFPIQSFCYLVSDYLARPKIHERRFPFPLHCTHTHPVISVCVYTSEDDISTLVDDEKESDSNSHKLLNLI